MTTIRGGGATHPDMAHGITKLRLLWMRYNGVELWSIEFNNKLNQI